MPPEGRPERKAARQAARQAERKAARQAERRAARRAEGLNQSAAPSDGVAVFHDIQVVPADAFLQRSFLVDGGPVWPDFASQTSVRLMRRGHYVDERAQPFAGPSLRIERPCVWGGYAIAHFGHLIADQVTRLLQSRVERPDDLVLFLVRPGTTAADVPSYVWQVLDWYGLRRDQVHCVTAPLQVAELRCYPQAEPIASQGPSEAYLQMLAQNAKERGLRPDPAEVVYVGRPGLLERGKGGAAGESYVLRLLAQAGVRILDPLKATLTQQLAVYAGARSLIFAEGSALHGRQLLGRLDQRITVLNRRPGARMAEQAIAARCRELRYVEACSRQIGMRSMGNNNTTVLGLALFDVAALLAGFAENGIDLRGLWDEAAYEAAVKADAEAWLTSLAELGISAQFDLDEAVRGLHAAGVRVVPVWGHGRG